MKKAPPPTATELMGQKPPPSHPRKLTLKFFGKERPQLDRAEFHCEETTTPGYWQQKARDGDHSFTWTKVPQAVSLIFLDYVSAGFQGAPGKFHFAGSRTGSSAASLGDAICKGEGKLYKLFVQFTKNGGEDPRVQNVFDGRNVDGKKPGERYLWIKTDYLPFEAVEIFWDSVRIENHPEVEKLAGQIRKAEKLPPASKLKLPEGEGSQPKAEPARQREQSSHAGTVPQKADVATETFAFEFKTPHPEPEKQAEPAKEQTQEPKAEEPEPIPVSEQFPEIDAHRDMIRMALEGGCSAYTIWAALKCNLHLEVEEEQVRQYIEGLLWETFPPGPISPKLFAIAEPDRTWTDNTEILPVVLDNCPPDAWTLRDTFQGTLILGAPGAGKTTGSGRHLAGEFLRQGFGGLVLTTKQSEANDWCKMIGLMGRGPDAAVVCPKGYLRLNMLQYEMERPTGGVKMTSNLVNFLKNIASAVGQKGAPQTDASFWENTGNELLENTIECFKFANYPITLDNLCSFILEAPADPESATGERWREQPIFGACMTQAEEAVQSADDARMFKVVRDYWFKGFPTLNPNTRSCITTAFSAMVRGLRSRYINDLLSTMTTITPDSCFSGRIIVVALPTNDYHEAGLMVQAAWKYLFQRAVLSRADRSRGDRCRPVFLWEDEAQTFLIDNDAQFQPVAREYRVACVKLSQNISNFYARFGGGDAARTKVDAIIGSLNTRFFHANGDLTTNEWASKMIGSEYKTIVNTSTTPPVYNGMNPFQSVVHGIFDRPTVTTSQNQVREPVIHPHEFTTLQTGKAENSFVTVTVMTQIGRTFPTGQNYVRFPFEQCLLPVAEYEKVLGDQVGQI